MRRIVLAWLALSATAASAYAQEEGEEGPRVILVGGVERYGKENWPAALVERPLTLGAGMMQLEVNLGVNLGDGAVLKPITLAPSFYYGITDQFTIGVAHTTHFLDAGLGGLCLVGDTDCGGLRYRFVAADVLVRIWRAANYEIAARGGIDVTEGAGVDSMGRPTTDFNVAARAGGMLRYHYGAFGADVGMFGILGTPKYFYMPVYLYYQATGSVALGVTSALRAGDGGAVSAGVVVLVRVTRDVDVGGGFELPTLKHTDQRTATLTLNLRF